MSSLIIPQIEDFAGFGDGMGFHELSAEIGGAWEVVDVDFEEMLQRLVR